VIGLRLGRAIGWTDPIVISFLILTPIAIIVFWRNASKSEYPVLPKRLLQSRYFATALASMFLAHMGVFVIWFVFPFYIIDILGLEALFLGVILAVMASFNALSSLVSGYLIDKIGHRTIGLIGLLSLSSGLFTMAYLTPLSGLFEIGSRIALVGIGIGLFQSAAYYQVISNTPGERMGAASGALSMSQAFGTVFSVATIGAIFAIITQTENNLLTSAGFLGPSLRSMAFMRAYQDVFHIGSIIVLASVPIFALLTKRTST
jgi:MFS family permease